jgi:hypothetical protein
MAWREVFQIPINRPSDVRRNNREACEIRISNDEIAIITVEIAAIVGSIAQRAGHVAHQR